MPSYNLVIMMGHLTRDPELSYTPSQTPVVDFGIATNRKYTGKDGQQKEDVCFIDCRAFGSQAENINKYLAKGRAVLVQGSLQFDQWEAQDGTKRRKHRLAVHSCQFLGSANQERSGASQSQPPAQAQEDTPLILEGDIPF